MAKRGQTYPWRMTYQWENGIGGKVACSSQDEAEMKADQVRQAAARRDMAVTVTVAHR